MTLWKKDRDMVLLSYIKGESNLPLDMIFTIKLQFNLIMVNFLRDYNENNEKTKNTKEGFIEYHQILFHKKLKEECLEKLKISELTKKIDDQDLENYIKDEIKIDNNLDSDEEDIGNESSILSRSNNRGNSKEHNSSINDKIEDSCEYIDERFINNGKKL